MYEYYFENQKSEPKCWIWYNGQYFSAIASETHINFFSCYTQLKWYNIKKQRKNI